MKINNEKNEVDKKSLFTKPLGWKPQEPTIDFGHATIDAMKRSIQSSMFKPNPNAKKGVIDWGKAIIDSLRRMR